MGNGSLRQRPILQVQGDQQQEEPKRLLQQRQKALLQPKREDHIQKHQEEGNLLPSRTTSVHRSAVQCNTNLLLHLVLLLQGALRLLLTVTAPALVQAASPLLPPALLLHCLSSVLW